MPNDTGGNARELPGHLAQIVAAFIWSAGVIVQKGLMADASVGSVLILQFAPSAAIFWLCLLAMGKAPRLAWSLLPIFAWGAVAPGFVLLLSAAGAAQSDGVTVAVMWGLVPILGPVLAHFILKEPLHPGIVIGGVISFAALIWMVLARSSGPSEQTLVGFLLLLVSVTLSAGTHTVGRKLNSGAYPWYQIAAVQVTGAAFTAVLATLIGGWSPPDLGAPPVILSALYLSLLMSTLNFSLYNFALSRVAAVWVSFYLALGPVVGTLAAALLLGEQLDAGDAIAIGVIIAATALPHVWRWRQGAA